MKNVFLLITLLSTGTTFAQTQSKGLQKITFGVVSVVSGTMNLTSLDKTAPLKLGFNLSPNICFVTTKTYHNLMYSIGTNSVRAVNGYKPSESIGLYVAGGKNFNDKGGYVGIGAEKFIKAGDYVTFFLFSELGKNISPKNKSFTFTIGMHTNIQTLIWKKESKQATKKTSRE